MQAHHYTVEGRRHTGDARSAWWFLRLLLVAVLAFDHLSAPFHSHVHQGIDSHESVVAQVDHHDIDSHVVDLEEHSVSHAAMAIKTEAPRIGKLPGAPSSNHVLAPPPSVAELVATTLELTSEHWRSHRTRPDFRSHRSLPPAGRAPPLHA